MKEGKRSVDPVPRMRYSLGSWIAVVAYRSSHDVICVVVSERATVISWTLDSHGRLEGSQSESNDEDEGPPLEQH